MDWIIDKTVVLDAPLERVWKALSEPAELARWFPDRAEFEGVPGARGQLAWDGHGTRDLEVIEFDPPRRFVWKWQGNDGRSLEGYATTVEWTLSPHKGGGTTLHVRETGFDTAFHHQQNVNGWNEELGELATYLRES